MRAIRRPTHQEGERQRNDDPQTNEHANKQAKKNASKQTYEGTEKQTYKTQKHTTSERTNERTSHHKHANQAAVSDSTRPALSLLQRFWAMAVGAGRGLQGIMYS